jgi:menaquinol-cytochrome c reductase iron-sulfur subunit
MISRKESIAPPEAPETLETVERRAFLRWVSGMATSVSAVLISIPVIRAFVSPTLQAPAADAWVKVADDTAVLDTGVPIRVDFVVSKDDAWIEARAMNSVWLYSEDGEKFKAYNGHCTHLGCGFTFNPQSKTFICPCHRGEFDVKTGAVLAGPPPRPLDELETQVRDSAVFVNFRDFRLGVAEKVEA